MKATKLLAALFLLLAAFAALGEAEFTGVKPFMGRGDWFTAGVTTPGAKVQYASSNTKVLTVDKTGKAIAIAEGTSVLTATLDNGETLSCEITVKGRPTSVKLEPARTELGVGESVSAGVNLIGGDYATLTWKSDKPSVASVDENGIITAISEGKATISVSTYNMLSANVTVKVGPAPSALEISESSLTLGEGQLYSLFAKGVNGYGSGVFTSSDAAVASVTAEGLVKAEGVGSCVIIATCYNGVEALCPVTVIPAPEGLWAWSGSSVLGAGETTQIETQNEPWSEAKAQMSFMSSDENVLSVSETGLVTAKKAGYAAITVATYNGIARELPFEVKRAPKSIALTVPGMIAEGDSADWLYALDEGAAGAASVSVSDENVLFAGDGVITALNPGRAYVTVTAYNGVSARREVTVMKKADSLSFVNSLYNLDCGSVTKIAAVTPENTFADVEYTLSDDGMCMLLPDGKVLALREGETVLTASAHDGKLTATAMISVKGSADSIDLTSIGIDVMDCAKVASANPDIDFTWSAKAFGVTVNNKTAALDLSNNDRITSLDEVRKLLDAFPNITNIDLSFTPFSYEELAALREEYRGRCKVVWTVYICNRWNVRTDQTAFSTLLGHQSVHHTSKEFDALKYCEDMMAIDLGHNKLSTLDFLLGMPHLKIIILSDDTLKDISVLGKLTELEYVEIFTNYITDISALSTLTNLIDLNISNNKVADLTPIMDLPNLERVWMTHISAPDYQKKAFAKAHPNCEVNTTANGPDRKGWRSHHRYFVLYEIFHTNVWIPWDSDVPPAPNYQAYY